MDRLDEGLEILAQKAIQLTQEIAFMVRVRNRMKEGPKRKQIEKTIKAKMDQAIICIETMGDLSKAKMPIVSAE